MPVTRTELAGAFAQGEIDGKADVCHRRLPSSLAGIESLTERYARWLEEKHPGDPLNLLQSQAYKIQLYHSLHLG